MKKTIDAYKIKKIYWEIYGLLQGNRERERQRQRDAESLSYKKKEKRQRDAGVPLP